MKSKQSESGSSLATGLSTRLRKVAAEPTSKPKSVSRRTVRRPLDPQLRQEYVRTAAYYRAEHRGFADNHELEDWLAAEAEVDERLA